jgi:hypothetical protein
MCRAGGLSGIVCPRCKTELEPLPWRQAISAAIAIAAGLAAATALRSAGVGSGWRLLAQVGTTVVVLLLAWGTVVRLRRRPDRSHPLGPLR